MTATFEIVMFVFNNILLGMGLAMDAFSVSLANGLSEPKMTKRKMCLIAGTFGFFQALMPMLGWVCIQTVVSVFSSFEKYIPWIALVLLVCIGGKMLIEGLKHKDGDNDNAAVGIGALLLQGIATSIDALSVGFTIADYNLPSAISASLIIAAVTFIICMGGLVIGRRFGTKLSNKADILGGVILIIIGIEIFVSGIL